MGEAGGGFASREPSAAGVVSKVVGTGATTGFTGLVDRGEGLDRWVGRWGAVKRI